MWLYDACQRRGGNRNGDQDAGMYSVPHMKGGTVPSPFPAGEQGFRGPTDDGPWEKTK